MDTQTQIERLIELAIIQRSELKRLVDELPQLREHLSSEIEKTFEDAEPQLRAELEEFIEKRATDATAKTGAALEAKIKELSSNLEISTQARFNAIIAEREQNARLAAEAEAKIAEHAASLPSAVKDIVTAELARFPRAGEIDQLRKEFAEPRGLNPRGKWQAGESYNKLDLVTINGDSYTSNTDGNRTRPSRSSADWTLVAARGTGGGGGPTSLSELTTVPSDGDLLIGSGTSWVTSNLTAGAGISITVGPGAITISATDGDITLDDGTAASPSLHFTNDPDTGIYRPAANTLGISVSGTQVAYFNENGLTVPSAGVVAGGSFHGANGNANNPSFSFTSDQDTGFYRHGTNELGISIGGTEKAVMTSTTFSITPNVSTSGNLTVSGTGVSMFGTTGKTAIQQFAGSGALVAGGWLYGVDEGLNFAPNGTGLNKKLVMAHWDGSAYRSVLEYSNVSSGTATLKLSDYGGLTTVGGNLTVSGAGQSYVDGSLRVGSATTPRGKLDAQGTYDGSAPSTSSTPIIRANNGGAVSLWTGGQAYTCMWQQAIQDDGSNNTKPIALQPLGGPVLIGTTTDTGQKLQVSGSGFITGSLAVGDRAAPAGVSLRVQQAGSDDVGLEWQRTSATNGILLSYNRASSAYTSMSYGASSHTFTILGANALTIDSSSNTYGIADDTYFSWDANSNRIGITKKSGSIGKFTYGSASSFTISQSSGTTIQASNTFTDRFTIDSSGDATFAGTVIANKATTAFRIPTAETPASASATGTVGTITWDASYIYVCTATNTWKRVAIATW